MISAINYSPQADELLRDGVIAPDRFKCPPWPQLMNPARILRPLAMHFELHTGAGNIAFADWREIERLLEETGTPYVNVHLAGDISSLPDVAVDSTDHDDIVRVARRFIDEIRPIVDRFGADRVIVENVVYRGPQGKFPYAIVAPELIHQVLDATGCGLLLDISHARISATAHGVDVREYIDALPVDRLREMHLTGVVREEVSGKDRDHMPLAERDWRLFEWSLGRIASGGWSRPWMIALEYGGIGPLFDWRSESTVIAEQFPRFSSLIAKTTASMAWQGFRSNTDYAEPSASSVASTSSATTALDAAKAHRTEFS